VHRRTFLHLALGTAAATAAGARTHRAAAQLAAGPFAHGVASGDPLPDRVIVWTRLTPSSDATPGSGTGAPTEVRYEVAADEAMTRVVRTGTVTTDPASDHTVNVDVDGLVPFTTYWYRFVAPGLGPDAVSEVGRLRTAPAADDANDAVRFGVVSCSNLEDGFFTSYRHLAGRDDLDAVLHLGDYLYEYGAGPTEPALVSAGRRHDPPGEIVTVEDYRRRHANYRTDADLRALTTAHPVICVWDDHEVANGTWREGAQNHQPGTEGDFDARRLAAYQAYFEWLPIRRPDPTGDPTRLYRRFTFGDLVELFMIDGRQYRDEPAGGVLAGEVADPVVDDPDRPFLGEGQRAWLEDGMTASTAAWKVVGNQVVFAPVLLTPALAAAAGPLLASLGIDDLPAVSDSAIVNGDQWDGYQVEQRALVEAFAGVDDVVVLTGDIHSSWANEIPIDAATYAADRALGTGSAGVELVCPSITSDGFAERFGSADTARLLATGVQAGNPWVRYLDGIFHGYGVLDVTADRVQYDFWGVTSRADPDAEVTFREAFQSERGSKLLAPGPGPLPDRAMAPTLPSDEGAAAPDGGDDGGADDDALAVGGPVDDTVVTVAVAGVLASTALAVGLARRAAHRPARTDPPP
jgi:alkaline phosphatase D